MDLVPSYFFLDEKLYKKIRVVKSENYVVAWSYEDEKRVWITYSVVRREATPAYKLRDVSKLIDKTQSLILSYVKRNLVEKPSGRLYTVRNKIPGEYMWSEQDILDLRDSLFELAPKNKYGEPYSNFKLISKAEILSRMRKDASFYVKDENGEFIKVWRTE